jgi:hypothetical protein
MRPRPFNIQRKISKKLIKLMPKNRPRVPPKTKNFTFKSNKSSHNNFLILHTNTGQLVCKGSCNVFFQFQSKWCSIKYFHNSNIFQQPFTTFKTRSNLATGIICSKFDSENKHLKKIIYLKNMYMGIRYIAITYQTSPKKV